MPNGPVNVTALIYSTAVARLARIADTMNSAMPSTTTVVTSARFTQGLTYADFLAQAAVNRDKFEANYQDAPLTADDIAFFKNAAAKPNGPVKVLAIAEAWCGDVYRELPTMARIAEAAGMTLRVFLRDLNADLMDEFLLNGHKRAIPVFAFYTADLRYITHFTERSASAHAELAAIADQVKAHLNLPADAAFGDRVARGCDGIAARARVADGSPPGAAVRRPAAAGRDGPGAGARAGGVPAR